MSTYVFIAGGVQVKVEAVNVQTAWSELFRRKNAVESVWGVVLPDTSSFKMYSQ